MFVVAAVVDDTREACDKRRHNRITETLIITPSLRRTERPGRDTVTGFKRPPAINFGCLLKTRFIGLTPAAGAGLCLLTVEAEAFGSASSEILHLAVRIAHGHLSAQEGNPAFGVCCAVSAILGADWPLNCQNVVGWVVGVVVVLIRVLLPG